MLVVYVWFIYDLWFEGKLWYLINDNVIIVLILWYYLLDKMYM